MTEVAGEVCDGILVHGFTTERYLREVTLPALERGLAKAGRTRADFEISYPSFVVTGDTEEAMAKAATATRQQIAFYGSTPAYRPVLELHGWGDLQTELNALSKQGEWVKMGELIDDDVLTPSRSSPSPTKVPDEVIARYGDVVDRISFYARTPPTPAVGKRAVAAPSRRPSTEVAARRLDFQRCAGRGVADVANGPGSTSASVTPARGRRSRGAG